MILEKEIEAMLVNAVRERGGLCLKWTCTGWAGVPDRIILMPGGRVMFAELKRPRGGRVSARQLWWSTKLTRLGFYHCFIWSREDVETFVAEVLA